MSTGTKLHFREFVLDTANLTLHRGLEKVVLRPKTFAMICYLAEHADRLVTKQEIKSALWPSAAVVDAALRVSIQEIRKALGDNPAQPRFIQTVGKNGYRFIAPVNQQIASATGSGETAPIVGRGAELNRLQQHFELAEKGKRQIVFVTGEAGIGKTTLVETFTRGPSATGNTLVAQGQCIEQYGAGEAYLPILDLLDRLCKLADGATTIAALRRVAPSWLLSLPGLVAADESAELARQTLGVNPERRLREIAAFLEEIAKTRTLLLVVEDLHWLDPSTLALLAYLARRREAARLLLIGTYRQDEVEQFNHPLKDLTTELQLHNYCAHLPIKPLNQAAVGEYLAARFETDSVTPPVIAAVYRRSDGNPLFMVNVTDYLVSRDAIVRENGSVKLLETSELESVPETIRDLIERQVGALPAQDQELVETAAVAGTTFSVAVIARVLKMPREATETQYRNLAEKTQFLQQAGFRKRPEGRGTARYAFVHALYQNVIYDRVESTQRRRLHQLIGERTEHAYVDATDHVAAELALHFERAGDHARAVKYLLASVQKAVSQCGYEEAIGYASSGLRLIKSLPETVEHTEIKLGLQLSLSLSLTATKGYAAAEAANGFQSARSTCQKVDKKPLLVQALTGLWIFHLMRAELAKALELTNEILKIASTLEEPLLIADGHMSAGITQFYLGNFIAAQKHFEKSLKAYDPNTPHARPLLYGWDTRIGSLTYGAANLWVLGYQTRDLDFNRRATSLAQVLSNPLNSVIADGMLAGHYQFRRQSAESHRCAERALKTATEYGFTHWIASASITSGWGLAATGRVQEGIARINEGLQLWKSTGAKAELPRFTALLSEAYLFAGQVQQGLQSVADAMTMLEQTNERFYEAELHRLKGDLLLKTASVLKRPSQVHEAESCFLQAIEVARRQKAKSLELRAAMSLCRIWQQQVKRKQARQTLKTIYGWFTEGFDTPDLKAAKNLVDELS